MIRPLLFALAACVVVMTGCPADEARVPSTDIEVEAELIQPDVQGPNDVDVDARDVDDTTDTTDVKVPPTTVRLERVFPASASAEYPRCTFSSPMRWDDGDAPHVVVATGGRLDIRRHPDGSSVRQVELPAPEGEAAQIYASPAIVGDWAIAAYHTVAAPESGPLGTTRLRHWVVVADLKTGQVHPDFPPRELAADFDANGGVEPFRPANALARAEVKHLPGATGTTAGTPGTLGRVYVTFGNIRDIQPWHGFAFELDLDAWRADPATAISGALITTPETNCGPPGSSGSRERICGGGLWASSGPLEVTDGGRREVILAPGNGQLDIARGDFANTLMRVTPGLDFDPECNATACAGFDPDDPAEACVASCKNLFVPRHAPGQGPPRPESGVCEGDTMWQCWQKLDYVGGSTPAFVPFGEYRLLAYPTKDGSVFLVDADHLGTMYDRKPIADYCGTPTDGCYWDWAGMIVNQPVVTWVDGTPLVIVPTFMPDRTHPAGVVGLYIVDEGEGPRFRIAWRAPAADTPAALTRFRQHSTRPVLQNLGGLEVVWVVDVLRGGPSDLLGVRTWDGQILVEQRLLGPSNRFTRPLVIDTMIYVPSCTSDDGTSFLEGWRVIAE